MTRYLSYLSFTLFVAVFISCDDGIDPPVAETVGGLEILEVRLGNLLFYDLKGSVTQDYTLTNDKNWLLDGAIHVVEGATLSIEAGTNVYAAFNEGTSYLSVERGARILAEGTSTQPIVFTTIRKLTSIPQPGDWGGIIINGRAPINVAGGEAEGEGNTGTYGGNDPEDNSGILRYVIVEYAGKQLGLDNELNSISLNGVGRGTTVEFVEALYGSDDGFEIFGGTVNLKYALAFGNADDSFDWTYGWSGYGQFWVVQQDPFKGDRGIEADNNSDDPDATPFSSPIISNITLLGAQDGDDANSGIKLRNGTKGFIYNAIVTNFSNHGVDVGETSAPFVSSDELVLEHSRVFDNGRVNAEGMDFKNATTFETTESNQFDDEPSLAGFIGSAEGSFDPSTIDPWFTSVTFIGAVNSNNDWTASWANLLR